MAFLEIKDLSISFGGLKALDNLSLTVDRNQFVGLMGPNGAGKTTLINCISRISTPTNGQISFDGQDVLKLSGDQIGKLGIARTFQDLNFFNLISDMLVIDYMKLGQFATDPGSVVGDGLKTRRSKANEIHLKNRARRVLEFFADIRESLETVQEERGFPAIFGREGFPDLLDVERAPIGILSFAWRRRLDLARAIVLKPRLLLLDEPMQGLPPSEIENLGRILKMIQSEFSLSALIVEHNVSTLMSISDTIVAMNYGKKITEGRPDEVRNNPEVIEMYLGASKSEVTPLDENSPTPSVPAVSTEETDLELQEPLLELRNIDLFYGQAQALFGVSLKLYPKQISCVLGTNGSGKSTLLKVIGGTEKPTMGEILYRNEYLPLGWPEAAVERGIQYVPQGHVIFPRLTVRENLKLGTLTRRKHGKRPEIDRAYYYFPELERIGNKLAIDLSGGQQQMLAIGQAIVAQPELLLLDEPSLGLAPKIVDLLFSIIKKISAEEKCSILLVEQSVSKSVEVSDFIYMMSAGVIVGKGSKHMFARDDSVIRKNLGFY